MSKVTVFISAFLLLSFVIIASAQDGSNITNFAQHNLPEVIAGYRVLAVLTPESTACMPSGSKRLLLQSSEPNLESFLRDTRIATVRQELANLGLTNGVNWHINIGGPGATTEQILSQNERWNAHFRNTACRRLGPLNTGSDGDELSPGHADAGRAVFENIDAGSYSNDNAQSAILISPSSIGNDQDEDGWSSFINTVKTDSTTFYLLQNGLVFEDGAGSVEYTTTSLSYVSQPYVDFPYSGNTEYWFGITYTNEVWWMCVYPLYDTELYTCEYDSSAPGNNLALDVNTGIWVENYNLYSLWYNGFSNPLAAYYARIYLNGSGQNWSAEHKHTFHYCLDSYPPGDAMSGSLVGGGAGSFNLEDIPPFCF